MLPALLDALHGPVGDLAMDVLVYVTCALLLIGVADVVTARAVLPAGARAGRRGARGRALVPAILAGLVAGIGTVLMLPEWFPAAALAEPLRESAVAIRNR